MIVKSLVNEKGECTRVIDRGKIVHEKCRFEKCVCFGFLDTSIIAWWLNGSNPPGDRSFRRRFTCALSVF